MSPPAASLSPVQPDRTGNEQPSSPADGSADAAWLRAVFDALPVAVRVQDQSGRLVLINECGARSMGRELTELIEQVPADTTELRLAATAASAASTQGSTRASAAVTVSSAASPRSRRRRSDLKAAPHGSGDAPELVATPTSVPDARSGSTGMRLVTNRRIQHDDRSLLVTTMVDCSDPGRMNAGPMARADHDALTGLPNRNLMQRIVGDSIARHANGGGFAMAFIDINRFRRINEYYSHAVGDGLLRAVARRICARIRASDTLARISGDEFLLIVDPIEDAVELTSLVERIGEVLREPFRINGHDISTSVSIGASLFPAHGNSYDELQRAADSAMHRSKRELKGRAALYSVAMGQAHSERLARELRLRSAVHNRRFRAALQPKVDLRTGRVVGFEALARWVEADGQVRGPDTFIALAGELGLLDDIAEQIANDVMTHFDALQRRFGPQTTISVNVSARQAGDSRFMQRLTTQLNQRNAGRSVVLEVTEDALLATQHFQQDILPMLRVAGIRVSIDDFGTGYSSLAMLADLMADEVKIDRAFITGIHERPRSQSVLKAIESLCATLGITMVAEGVEQGAELDYLRRHTRIGVAQGFYFNRALIIDEALRIPVSYPLEDLVPTSDGAEAVRVPAIGSRLADWPVVAAQRVASSVD